MWVKRQRWKYYGEDSSPSEEEEDKKNGENVPTTNIHEGEQEVELSNSDADSQDGGDPRAKRCDTDFYQEIGDQCHFRDENDPDMENSDMANIINMTNPRSFDFSEFAKGQVLTSISVMLGRLNSLKDNCFYMKNFSKDNFNFVYNLIISLRN